MDSIFYTTYPPRTDPYYEERSMDIGVPTRSKIQYSLDNLIFDFKSLLAETQRN